jgi:hypothetical protein
MCFRFSRLRLLAVLTGLAWAVSAPTAARADNDAPLHEGGAHPLDEPLAWAYDGLKHVDSDIKDYSCTLVKRERVQGELLDREYIFTKVRHEPFSVYMYFLKPSAKKGNEVVYVEGENDGKMWAIAGTGFRRRIGVVSLVPDGPIAMEDNRYPITMTGFRVLVERLIELGEQDQKYGETEVQYYKNAKINGRTVTCIEVKHPKPRKEFRYHLARIFVDDEMQVPIRLEAYSWPTTEGGKPVLVEEYTYLNVKLNNGYTDEDFNYKNENYHFVSAAE